MLIVPFSANFIYAEGEIEQQTGQSREQASLSQSQAAADDSASLEFPNYTFEEEENTAGVNGFISGVLNENTRAGGLSLNYSVISLTEGGSFTLTLTGVPTGQTIAWQTYKSSIATVSGGTVTGKKAGSTTVMASYFDGKGNLVSATCTVHVVIANGGVYRIKNNNSGLYMSVRNGNISNNAQAEQYSDKSNAAVSEYIRQLWRIKYMDDGYYNIRPYINYGMALYANGNNVSIYSSGYTDDIFDMASFRWTIEWDGVGYVFKYNGSDSYTMQTYNSATTSGAVTRATSYYPVNNCRWTVTNVSNAPKGLMLYNTLGSPLDSTHTEYVAPEEEMTLSELELQAILYVDAHPNVVNTYQNLVRWTSGSSAVATVDSVTGTVTGVAEGQTTITARITLNSTLYSCSYTLDVSSIPSGTYFIQNRRYEKYIQIDDDVIPTASGATMEIWEFDGGDDQRWDIVYLNNGYYKIVSVASGFALSVPVGSTTVADVDLEQSHYSNGYRQQWKIILTENGSYKIKARASESSPNDLVMDVETLTENPTEQKVQQRIYVDNNSYGDEWYITCHDDYLYKLLALNIAGQGRNRYFEDVSPLISANLGTDIYTDYYESHSKSEMLEFLYNNEIFIIHTHGNKNVIQISEEGATLSNADIEQMDLSNLKFALLVACYTGLDYSESNITNNTPGNFIEQMICNGAETVVGFSCKINITDGNVFAKHLMELMVVDGYSVSCAISEIDFEPYLNEDVIVPNIVIGGNKDYRF